MNQKGNPANVDPKNRDVLDRLKKGASPTTGYSDTEKERRYQEWKSKQGSSLGEDILNAIVPSAEAADNPNVDKYIVINTKTGYAVSGPQSTMGRARQILDKKDNEYGGYAHKIVTIPAATK